MLIGTLTLFIGLVICIPAFMPIPYGGIFLLIGGLIAYIGVLIIDDEFARYFRDFFYFR